MTKGIGEERRTRKLKINKIQANLAHINVGDLFFLKSSEIIKDNDDEKQTNPTYLHTFIVNAL